MNFDAVLARRRAICGAVASLCFFCVSCGNRYGLYPVRGKVLCDGEPAKGAEVIFHPKNDQSADALHPSGIVQADGTYKLSCYGKGNGAPPGDYYVFVRWLESEIPQGHKKFKKKTKPVPGDVLKNVYQDHKNPKFFAVVKPGNNEIEPFEIKAGS